MSDELKVGDIIQITNESHSWYPALLIIDEVKSWGVQACVVIPQSNDGSKATNLMCNRLENKDFYKVGEALVLLG